METESVEIDFDKMAGLTPAVVQDSDNGRNPDAWIHEP